ncbi:hypothetical protein AN644_05145 [Candidatus Epulonipiscium fishelsonii]|nr:hypothetical protein AN644_05145 [Epulopiscium sp. SCG-C06WGA-EpuloA1]
MQTMTKRQLDILKMLSINNEYISTKHIAKNFNISERTVRYDLDRIESSLEKIEVKLVRVPKNGNKLVFKNFESKKNLLYQIEQFSNTVLTQEDRISNLEVLLLIENTTINRLATQLEVSQNTIICDLRKVKIDLEKYNLTIETKSYQGTKVKGKEEDIRYAFINIYNKSKYSKENLYKKFDTNVSLIENYIKSVEKELGVKYSKSAIEELQLIIIFSLWRIKKGYFIDCQKEIELKPIFNILKETLCLEIIDFEMYYLAKWFKSAKLINDLTVKSFESEINIIGLKIIKDFEEYLGIKFTQDIEIINSIIIHFNVAIYRLKNNFNIHNPFTAEVRYEIGIIYKITEEILRRYEKELNVVFPSSEIAYMAMHFGALFENLSTEIFNPRVVIICNSGLATSKLLYSRIKIALPNLNVIAVYAVEDLENLLQENTIDLVITTIPLSYKNIKTIEVNPLLSEQDCENIRKFILKKTYQKSNHYLVNRYEQDGGFSVTDIIKEENVQFNLVLIDWREAIKEATVPLIQDKTVEPIYVKDIIKNIEKSGTYMVFIPEIAFVHAKPTHVNKNSISLVTLKNNIQFGDNTSVPIKVIVVLANKTENMNLIKLINILLKENNMEKLKNAKSYIDLTNII